MVFSFIAIPSLAMLLVSFPFVREKFGDEKLVRRFESILTAPVSLKAVWAGKMASILILSYPTVIIVIILLIVIWNIFGGLNPIYTLSAPVWIMALIITPLLPMIYNGFSSWSILRFTHPKLMQILLYFTVALGVLTYISSGTIVNHIVSVQIVNWSIVVYSTITIIISAILVLLLIQRLDKEKVTI
jgi:ABC-type Na+ efflux pump permease subunit